MNAEREKAILEILIRDRKVTVHSLAETLYASEPSIRRDLKSLERQKLLRRVHGGAILEENTVSEMKIPFFVRELESSNEKVEMAKRASRLIHDGDVIFLDASTSAYSIIPFLTAKKDVTVITNGIKTLTKLSEYNIKTISTGGDVVNSCLAMVGELACASIENYHADLTFFSCRGVSEDGTLTDIAEKEDFVRRKMIAHSKKAYLLCSQNKFGHTYFHRLCHASQLTGIIAIGDLPENLADYAATIPNPSCAPNKAKRTADKP